MLQRLLTLELAQWIRKHCTQTLFLMLFIKPQSFTLLGKKRNWLSKINQRYIGMGRKLQWLSVAQSCPTRWVPMDYSPPGSSIHGIFPGKNTGVGSHSLLQGILPTQGSNPGLLHCKQILYHLSHQGSPHFFLNDYCLVSFPLLSLQCSQIYLHNRIIWEL